MTTTVDVLYSFLRESNSSNILKENLNFNVYNDKKYYIEKYFHLLDKEYIKEGVIDLVKSFITFCFKIIDGVRQVFNTYKSKAKDKISQTKVVKFFEKDKDAVKFFSIGKSIIKTLVKTAFFKQTGIWKIYTFTSSYLVRGLSLVGIGGTLPNIIVSIVAISIMNKIVSIIIKLFTTILGAIKKWATNNKNVENEAERLAVVSIQANKQIVNSLPAEKRIQAEKKLKEKIDKFNEYKKNKNKNK